MRFFRQKWLKKLMNSASLDFLFAANTACTQVNAVHRSSPAGLQQSRHTGSI
jgi:hypothetical protein